MDQPIPAAVAATKPPCCCRIATHFVMHSSQICADAPATRRSTASAPRPQNEQRRCGRRCSKLRSVARHFMSLNPAAPRSARRRQILVILVELLARDPFFGPFGELRDKVDDLLR